MDSLFHFADKKGSCFNSHSIAHSNFNSGINWKILTFQCFFRKESETDSCTEVEQVKIPNLMSFLHCYLALCIYCYNSTACLVSLANWTFPRCALFFKKKSAAGFSQNCWSYGSGPQKKEHKIKRILEYTRIVVFNDNSSKNPGMVCVALSFSICVK